jgi:hypothetical protein
MWLAHLEGISFILPNGTKLCLKSYGTGLVRIRWKFSDEALWISDAPTDL